MTLPTIADVAQEAGVSAATVDRALNNRAGIHARTRARVLSSARRLGYADDGLPVATAARPTLAVIVPGGDHTFFATLAAAFERTGRDRTAELRLELHRLEAYHPEALAAHVRQIAANAGAVAVIALDHPAVREAIRDVVAAGCPILTLVSDISDVPRLGYVGIDNRAAGRLAGFLLGRMVGTRPGPVALFVGSLRYRGHEEREMGFRRVLAEDFPDIEVLSPRETHDDSDQSFGAAEALLRDRPDLVGIYNVGGGTRGIGRALEAAGRARAVVFVGHELTVHTRRFLVSGTMDAVLDQDPVAEANLAIDSLLRAARDGLRTVAVPTIPTQAIFRENIPNQNRPEGEQT